MNKYRDKSDFEINKAVALMFGFNIYTPKNIETLYIRNDGGGSKLFDPCNNPADAMPIVIENKIPMKPHDYKLGAWECGGVGMHSSIHKNPYRAAMEVFLMMKDAENEKI